MSRITSRKSASWLMPALLLAVCTGCATQGACVFPAPLLEPLRPTPLIDELTKKKTPSTSSERSSSPSRGTDSSVRSSSP